MPCSSATWIAAISACTQRCMNAQTSAVCVSVSATHHAVPALLRASDLYLQILRVCVRVIEMTHSHNMAAAQSAMAIALADSVT